MGRGRKDAVQYRQPLGYKQRDILKGMADYPQMQVISAGSSDKHFLPHHNRRSDGQFPQSHSCAGG